MAPFSAADGAPPPAAAYAAAEKAPGAAYAGSGTSGSVAASPKRCPSKAYGWSTGSGERMTARSTACWSSRMLPGQGWRCSESSAAGEIPLTSLPISAAVRMAKREASEGMSSGRARSGGIWMGMVLRRKYRSCRKLPAAASAARSRLVVATTRTSTRMGVVPPTRSNSCSCSTRSSLACRSSRISEISSSSSVPRCARSKAPSTRFTAPGERPPLVAEERALHQSLRERGAVELDEGPVAAVALVVDRPREQLLARAALALQQHRGAGGRRHRHRLQDAAQRRALADDLPLVAELHHLAAQRLVLAAQPHELQRLVHRQPQLLGAHRLGDVVDRPGLDRRHRVLDARVAGEHDQRDVVPLALQQRQELQPGEPRHAVVGDDQVHPSAREHLQRLGHAARADRRWPARSSVSWRIRPTAGSSSTWRIVAMERAGGPRAL